MAGGRHEVRWGFAAVDCEELIKHSLVFFTTQTQVEFISVAYLQDVCRIGLWPSPGAAVFGFNAGTRLRSFPDLVSIRPGQLACRCYGATRDSLR